MLSLMQISYDCIFNLAFIFIANEATELRSEVSMILENKNLF